jgi:pimeloyl-ACP methyl ester carboxylesterase
MARIVLDAAPPRFAVAGLSMGGVIALELWRQAPERITHLALLDTTPYADPPQRRKCRMLQIEKARNGGQRDVLVESMMPLYFARRNRSNALLLELILGTGMRLGPDVFEQQSLALRDRESHIDRLPTITCSTLVLGGREDALCPPAWHVRIAEMIPRADLAVLAECGHLSPLESPGDVNAGLMRLLARRR